MSENETPNKILRLSVLDYDSCKECKYENEALQCCKTCTYAHRLEIDRITKESEALKAECKKFREALKSIAEDPFNCGCYPICRCHSQQSLEITIEELRSTAYEALNHKERT